MSTTEADSPKGSTAEPPSTPTQVPSTRSPVPGGAAMNPVDLAAIEEFLLQPAPPEVEDYCDEFDEAPPRGDL